MSGTKSTDAAEVAVTSDAAQRKARSASVLFDFVLVIVSIALLGAFLQFVGVALFAWRRAQVANAIASSPDVAPQNAAAADRIISPESAAMIVQISQSGLAIVAVALLFFFGYLTAIYSTSFTSPPDRPLASSTPSAAEKSQVKAKDVKTDHRRANR